MMNSPNIKNLKLKTLEHSFAAVVSYSLFIRFHSHIQQKLVNEGAKNWIVIVNINFGKRRLPDLLHSHVILTLQF